MQQAIPQLRKITQAGLEEPPVYRIFRIPSIYLTWILLRTHVTPNSITVLWCLCILGAGVAYSRGDPFGRWIGITLLLVHFLLDCVDGELARARGTGGKLGSQIEQICHWLSSGALLMGIAAPEMRSGSLMATFVCAAAVVGDYTFHFVFYQLMLLIDRGHDYKSLHKVAAAVYYVMPLNINLLIVFSLFGQVWLGLIVWAILANAVWLYIFLVYFRHESSRLAQAKAASVTEAGQQ